MAAEEPEANSQLPETSMELLRNPDIEDPEAQVMLLTMSFPVRVIVPPSVSVPLITVEPEAVNWALFEEVALTLSDAPALMVRLAQTPVVPEITGWLAGAEGMVTLSVAAGAPAGDQLVEVFQAVLVVPVHVFCAVATMQTSIATTVAIILFEFITIGFSDCFA